MLHHPYTLQERTGQLLRDEINIYVCFSFGFQCVERRKPDIIARLGLMEQFTYYILYSV